MRKTVYIFMTFYNWIYEICRSCFVCRYEPSLNMTLHCNVLLCQMEVSPTAGWQTMAASQLRRCRHFKTEHTRPGLLQRLWYTQPSLAKFGGQCILFRPCTMIYYDYILYHISSLYLTDVFLQVQRRANEKTNKDKAKDSSSGNRGRGENMKSQWLKKLKCECR